MHRVPVRSARDQSVTAFTTSDTNRANALIDILRFPEVVLSVLLHAFRFSLTEKEIHWHWASVDYPTMDSQKTDHSLVLNVERL